MYAGVLRYKKANERAEDPNPVKKAVLVAVHLKQGGALEKVSGAHKDAKKLWDLLVNTYHYDPKNITFLIDSKKAEESDPAHLPTRENILKAMRELVKDRKEGDHIVFSFSGHGDQTEAERDKDEVDGKDEILVPSDYTVKTGSNTLGNFISDDDIREIFVDGLAEGVQCTLIFDCCHSGTACDLPNEDEDEDDDETKGSQPGAPGFTKRQTLHHRHAARAKEADPNMAAVSGAKQVTSWSACSDDQITYGGGKGGYFVDAFVQILQDTNRNGKTITHRELLLALRTKLEERSREAYLKKHGTSAENQGDASADTGGEASAENQGEASADTARGEAPAANLDDFKAPRPQLGSLIPECILDKRFIL